MILMEEGLRNRVLREIKTRTRPTSNKFPTGVWDFCYVWNEGWHWHWPPWHTHTGYSHFPTSAVILLLEHLTQANDVGLAAASRRVATPWLCSIRACQGR